MVKNDQSGARDALRDGLHDGNEATNDQSGDREGKVNVAASVPQVVASNNRVPSNGPSKQLAPSFSLPVIKKSSYKFRKKATDAGNGSTTKEPTSPVKFKIHFSDDEEETTDLKNGFFNKSEAEIAMTRQNQPDIPAASFSRHNSGGAFDLWRVNRKFSLMDFRSPRSSNDLLRHKGSFFIPYTVSRDNVPGRELDWLDGDGFLERLEAEDEIDHEILRQEVDALRSDVPVTCRQSMVTLLTGRVFTVIVLLVALLDAVAIMAQIIIDVQASIVKSTYLEQRDLHLYNLLMQLQTPPFNEPNITTSDELIKRLSIVVPARAANGNRELLRRRSVSLTEDDTRIIHNLRRRRAVKSAPEIDTTYIGLLHHYTQLYLIAQHLQYLSVSLLGFLVLEVLLKILGFGTEFIHHKVEVIDAIVVTTSFILDIVFINDHANNIPVVMFLFVWEIIRVISAVILQNKKRVEFLMQVLGKVHEKKKSARDSKRNSREMAEEA